ncbi:MAG TPA: response regulator transcription factor [Actinomycetota bacterium]|nr:response regulator transcription factor [Actinomycetota bacterium]
MEPKRAPANGVADHERLHGIGSCASGHATVPIAVSAPAPMFRKGLVAALGELGFAAEEPDDLLQWASTHRHGVVVISLSTIEDLSLVSSLRRLRNGLVIAALLPDARPADYRAALQAGASAPVARDAPVEEIVAVIRQALDRRTLLPAEVARRIVSEADVAPEATRLRDEEIDWLRAMAGGLTIEQLADEAGYSRRTMFRILRDLYRRMGATSRTEALLQATRWGLLSSSGAAHDGALVK